jgi:Tfp pilus assembly protein PilN
MIKENKVSKYILYAIGEIVLVVIGILIALSINNWNEERKENVIRDSYLVRLLIDQEKDNINLEQLLKDRKAYIEKVEKYTEYFNKGDYSLSQLKDSAMSIPMDLHRYIPADITYKELINTGNIRLINEDLRVLLAELSREKELSGIINNITINDIFAQNRELKKYWDFTQNFHETLNIEQDKSNVIHGLM